MLKNINSSFFIKLLFIFIDEEKKLELIRSNKCLQKNLDISINNYKHITGSYIIYEPNGIGKEYFGYNDTLKFEGGYLNGKRNGKGKEYDINGNLIFSGEYLNGKRNGKGQEYNIMSVGLSFEGEYLNGKRNGKGKEYYSIDQLSFEGEYLNGKEWIGTRYNTNGDIVYTLNNNINGKGKEYGLKGNLEF